MQAEVHILFQSDFYRILDFRCACMECSLSKVEQCNYFSICFVRSGFYEQRVFRREQEMHIGRMLVTKPEIEYVIRHIDSQPDLCTSFNFTQSFYESVKEYFRKEGKWFFSNPDLQSVLLASHADTEFLHQQILQAAARKSSLELDDLVLQLVEKVMFTLGNKPNLSPISGAIKRHHLSTVEKAQEYLFKNFSSEVTLHQLADHCCVSPFHFSRIFKEVMNESPHQYLNGLRLNHAKWLLQTTSLSVTEVSFQSGYKSLEHFTTSFKNRFKASPHKVRRPGYPATALQK